MQARPSPTPTPPAAPLQEPDRPLDWHTPFQAADGSER
jgi:hypothetical protein